MAFSLWYSPFQAIRLRYQSADSLLPFSLRPLRLCVKYFCSFGDFFTPSQPVFQFVLGGGAVSSWTDLILEFAAGSL